MARSARVTVGSTGLGPRQGKKRRGRLRRVLFGAFLVIVVLVVGLVALAPMIAGSVAPGMIERALNPRLNGSIDVSDVHVRWFRAGAPVQTATVAVYDDARTKIADVTIESEFGLLSALGGIGDLGEFVVTAKADVIRYSDGTTNLQRVIAPLMPQGSQTPAPPTPSGQGATVPPQFRAVLRIASITGTYTDQSLATPLRVTLEQLTGRAVFSTGRPAEASLDLAIVSGQGATPQRGTLTLRATIDQLTSASGAFTLDRASANINVTARDLPLGVADSLAGLKGTLTRAIGDRLGFDLSVVGTVERGTGRVALSTDAGTSLAGAITIADRVLTSAEPLTFTLDTARAVAADPAIAAALTGSDAAKIITLPTLSVSLADLRLALPTPGATGIDLRGARATVTAALGEMGGSVLVPGQTQPRVFSLSPMNVVLSSADLGDALTLSTSGQARIDNQPAGDLAVNLAARDLLDSSGGFRPGLPGVSGSVVVSDFTMAIVQPILDALAPDSGLTLTKAIGPTLDLRFTAESQSSGGTTPAPGEIPTTTLGLSIDSDNITAGGNLRIARDAVRTLDDQGVWLRVGSIVPVAGGLLSSAGVALQSGGEVTLRVQDVLLADPMSATPPLDRARARVSMSISETRGQLTRGASPTNFRIDPGTLGLTVDGAGDTIALVGRLDTLVTGNGRLTAEFDTTLSGLLGQLAGKVQAATATGQGVRLTATEIGRWLVAVLPAGAPVSIDPGGQIVVAINGLGVAAPPTRPPGAPVGKAPVVPDIVQRLSMNLDVTGRGVRFAPVLQPALPGEPAPTPEFIDMTSLALAGRVAPGAAPSLTLESAFSVAGQQFTAGGNLALAKPLGQSASMREMIPRGRLALEQIPVELVRLLPIDLKGSDAQSVNLTALAGEGVGRKIDVVLGLVAPRRGEPAENTTVALRVTGRGLRLDAGGVVNSEGLAATETVLTATITPRLAQMLQNNFAAALEHKPTLMENATVRATIAPFTVPLDANLAPRPGSTVTIRAAIETAMNLNNLVLAENAQSQPINAGPVRFDGVRATASVQVPMGTVPGATSPQPQGPMGVEFAATLRRPDRPQSSLLGVTGSASMNAGSLDARASVGDLDLAWIESALDKQGMLTGALGPSLRADVTLVGDPSASATATLSLAAANLSMAQPVRVALTPAGISLGAPLAATFTASPEWATRYIFGQSDPANVMVRAQRSIPFSLSVANLTITRGERRGPLVPGEWGVDATITAPEIAVSLKDGNALRYMNPEVIVRTARNDPRRLNASLRMTEARQIAAPSTPATPEVPGVAPAPANDPAENIMRLSIVNLMGDTGTIDLAGATAEAVGRIPGFPTDLIDAIAKQNGLLVELLGPAVTVDITARNVPLAFASPRPSTSGLTGALSTQASSGASLRGRVEAELRSDRARARLAGDINNMVLTTSEPLAIDLSEITRAFSEKIARGMPLVSTFEKPRSLQAATLRGEAITLPMDSNMANLNGRFAIDPGELQFTSSNILASLLKAAGGQSSGVAGRRLQPFTFTIDRGVVNYDRFTLPLGEFEVSTSGKVDLVNNSMDLLVYLPVGAVADDALGMFNLGLGSALSQIAPGFSGSLPFRIRGPMGSARPEPAIDVFVKEFGSQLVNPGNLLERFLPGRGGNNSGTPGGFPFPRRGGG